LRARASGSAGTHNGMRSIVQSLGGTGFPRLRVGIGRGDRRRDLADVVLSKFEPAEVDQLGVIIARAADAAEMFAAEDILKVMNAYNPDPAVSDEPPD
jgi:peptidyl-tRNA hydrolase, PTH1 family